MKRSHLTAGGVVLVIGAWMLSGQFTDHAPEAHNAEPAKAAKGVRRTRPDHGVTAPSG